MTISCIALYAAEAKGNKVTRTRQSPNEERREEERERERERNRVGERWRVAESAAALYVCIICVSFILHVYMTVKML